jgi:hypothetical protein
MTFYATTLVRLVGIALLLGFTAAAITARSLAFRFLHLAAALGALAGSLIAAAFPFVLFQISPPTEWTGGGESMFGFDLLFVCWLAALILPAATWPLNRRLLHRWQRP